MKQIAISAFILLLSVSGCKKNTDDSPQASTKIIVNNTTVAFKNVQYIIGTDEHYQYVDIMNYDTEMDTKFMEINIEKPAVGDFTFSEGNFVSIELGDKMYDSKNGSGKITITHMDSKTITGTFAGTFIEDETGTNQLSGEFTATLNDLGIRPDW